MEMPLIGLGTYLTSDSEIQAVVEHALSIGYRSIDTASFYKNETGIGAALAASTVPRKDLFITSKVWNDEQGYNETLRAYERSLMRLGLDYLDLYLVHWPISSHYRETWRALLTLHREKQVRSIGVSNFHRKHLQAIQEESDIVPVVNQIELHPMLIQEELRSYCAEHNIAVVSWAPLMKGKLNNAILRELAQKHKKTAAQVVLRWHVQHDLIVIPKSTNPSRIQENTDIFDFSLSVEDMRSIDSLHTGHRFSFDPDTL